MYQVTVVWLEDREPVVKRRQVLRMTADKLKHFSAADFLSGVEGVFGVRTITQLIGG